MLNQLENYIKDQDLFTKDDTILVAISGGIDSVVMLDMLVKSGYTCGLAHCNFNLRGEESNADEEFVRNLALRYESPIFVISFNTKEYASENGISIQMAARELRYKWFEEIRVDNYYNYVALAHQKDDVLETFFINLLRGTGIKGLSGIKAKKDKIVRPLLFIGRNDIEQYCNDKSLIFREDSSNTETKYIRNKIRHNILPVFSEINQHFAQTMIDNISRFKEISDSFDDAIKMAFKHIVTSRNNNYYIDIEELRKFKHLSLYLYSYLKQFSFSKIEVDEIIKSLDGLSGKQFFSLTHRLVKDRSSLIITELHTINEQELYYINTEDKEIKQPVNLTFEIIDNILKLNIIKDSAFAYLDYDKLDFPLVLRKWKQGEYFIPFGMDGFKKLSDFFIDNKMSLPEKESTWIMSLGQDIVWIVGKRIDNRFRITEKTKKVLLVKLNFKKQ